MKLFLNDLKLQRKTSNDLSQISYSFIVILHVSLKEWQDFLHVNTFLSIVAFLNTVNKDKVMSHSVDFTIFFNYLKTVKNADEFLIFLNN